MKKAQTIMIISLLIIGIIILVKFAIPQNVFNSEILDIKCGGDGLSKISCNVPQTTVTRDISEGTILTWSIASDTASRNVLYTIINVINTEKGGLSVLNPNNICPLRGYTNGCDTPCYFYDTDNGASIAYIDSFFSGTGYQTDLRCGKSYSVSYAAAVGKFKEELMVLNFAFYNGTTMVATGSAYGYCNLPAQTCVVKELNIPSNLPNYNPALKPVNKAYVTLFEIYPSTINVTNETICALTQLRCSVPEVIEPNVTLECLDGETRCEENNYQVCESNKYVNKGVTVGQCEVQCYSNDDCSINQKCSNNLCVQKIDDTASKGSMVKIIFWTISGAAIIFIGYMFYRRLGN